MVANAQMIPFGQDGNKIRTLLPTKFVERKIKELHKKPYMHLPFGFDLTKILNKYRKERNTINKLYRKVLNTINNLKIFFLILLVKLVLLHFNEIILVLLSGLLDCLLGLHHALWSSWTYTTP